jgi:hypothetical protein
VTVRRFVAALSLGVLASAGVAGSEARAQSFDLTGTWTGKWICQGFDGAKFKLSNRESTLLVTQTGNAIAARIDGELAYNGGAILDADAPTQRGEVALVRCGTDVQPLAGPESEILRAKARTSEEGAGRLRGIGARESAFPDVLTCNYSYRRTDAANPNVQGCP